MSVASASKAHVMNRFIKNESKRIIESFAANPTSKHRAITKVVKRLLLDGPYLLNGRYWEVKAKSLGAGVYKLTLEEAS